MDKRFITVELVAKRAQTCAEHILESHRPKHPDGHWKLYGVPRGGIAPVYAVQAAMLQHYNFGRVEVVTDPEEADVLIDDVLDSGATRDRYKKSHPWKPFVYLFNKQRQDRGKWLVFPWEQGEEDTSTHDVAVRMLQVIGEDPTREGLLETPKRVTKAWAEWFGGYGVEDPHSVLKVFEDGAEKVDEMVVVHNIPVFSHCEHHIAPIVGIAHVGYIPDGKIVGLSKLSRLVEVFARRLQVQERLTTQIADTLEQALNPKGIGVLIRAEHLCMTSRGVNRPGTLTTTSAMRGSLLNEPSSRAEFMALCRDAERNK